MKNTLKTWMFFVLIVSVSGCRTAKPPVPVPGPPELSPEQRREMQVEIWDAPVDIVFAATVATFQELGWALDAVDKGAGMIRSSTQRKRDAFGPEDERYYDATARRETAKRRADESKKWTRWTEAVVHIEPWEGKRTRQRIVFNLRGSLPAMSYSERQKAGVFNRDRDVMIHVLPVEQSVEVEVSEAYTDLFDRIGTGIAQRQVLGDR